MISVSHSIQNEAVLFGYSFLLGAGLMMFYDILRIFRRIIPRGIVWISLEDFIYWILFGAAVFILLYRENDGALRWFIIAGIALGVIIYYELVSRWAMRFMGKFIWRIKKRLKNLRKAIKMKLGRE